MTRGLRNPINMDEKRRKRLKRVENWVVNILFYACIAFIGFVVWHIFLFASFTIPSYSMYPTVRPGDVVLVDKVTTGARLFDIFDAAAGEEVKIRRTPRFRNYKRGDILVFNFPFQGKWNKIAMDYHVYYMKRCVGLPGDTLEIRNFQYFINGVPSTGGGDISIPRRIYDRNRIEPDSLPGYRAMRCDSITHWTIRDLGPLYIPKKGETVNLYAGNYIPYKKAVEWESKKKLKCKNGILTLGGTPIDSYTFTEDYYFMAGDNSADSQDSRYWGVVPDKFVVGRAFVIWWSEQDGNINKERVMTFLK